jgi:hypothetical protein
MPQQGLKPRIFLLPDHTKGSIKNQTRNCSTALLDGNKYATSLILPQKQIDLHINNFYFKRNKMDTILMVPSGNKYATSDLGTNTSFQSKQTPFSFLVSHGLRT